MRLKFIYTIVCFIFLVTCFSSQAQINKDLDKPGNLPMLWEHYWNIHNMDSMGTLLDDHIEFINVAGRWLKGKTETVLHHQQRHSGITFKNSCWTTDSVEIKYIKPDLAVIHLSWGITGDNDPDGTPRDPRHGIFTWLVVKQHKQWKILVAQNTNKTY